MGHILANEAVQVGGLGALILMGIAAIAAIFTKN